MDKRKSFAVLFILSSFLFSCSSNPLDIKLDNSPVEIEFTNVDSYINGKDREEVTANIKMLDEKLGDLFIFELSHNIRANVVDSTYPIVYDFYNMDYIKEMEAEKEKLYPGLTAHEGRINKAFQYLTHYFGDSLLPKNIFYMNKMFSLITCNEENISVGLESYISPKSDIVESVPGDQLYQWQRDRMDISFLERDVLLSWIQVQLFQEMDGNLVEHMVQAGKILYILNAVFPKETEAYILRYSEDQYKWAKNNEENVWNYLVGQQMLFKNDETIKTNFMNEGPTTIGLEEGAPDRYGQYLGYKIVKGYMLKNKALSLQELINTKYNNILQTYEIH